MTSRKAQRSTLTCKTTAGAGVLFAPAAPTQGVIVRGSTRVVGIFGDPVAHSLSPAMHNAAFSTLGLNWVYVPFLVPAALLAEAVRALPALGIRGVNVTVPHKEAVMEFLDGCSELAREVGAVNTIIHTDGRLWGENTDVYGVRQALRGLRLRRQDAVVVGAGGSARAVLVALREAGVARVWLANRTVERARELARRFSTGTFVVEPLPLSRLRDAPLFTQVRIVVNATSLGLHHKSFPPLAVEATPKDCLFFDLVYGHTTFLRRAAAAGRPTADGREMLLHQGAAAFRLWTKRQPPLAVMRNALETALAQG